MLKFGILEQILLCNVPYLTRQTSFGKYLDNKDLQMYKLPPTKLKVAFNKLDGKIEGNLQ